MKSCLVLLLCFTLAVPANGQAVDVSACLGAHNAKRNLHVDTPNLVWDAALAAESAQYALHLATTNTLKHSFGYYGENLYKSTGSSASNCEAAVTAWYNEIEYYNYDSSDPMTSPNFTQIVWKSTTSVGVGVATATHQGHLITVVVARYRPAGNMIGAFQTNVLQLKSA